MLMSRRHIGPIGTTARVVLGFFLVGYGLIGGTLVVSQGQLRTGFEPLGVLLGLIGFPAVLLAWQWLRARRDPTRFEATGPVGTAVNMAIFLALFLTPWYARAFSLASDAALVFYGASMLLAALRALRALRGTGTSGRQTPAAAPCARTPDPARADPCA